MVCCIRCPHLCRKGTSFERRKTILCFILTVFVCSVFATTWGVIFSTFCVFSNNPFRATCFSHYICSLALLFEGVFVLPCVLINFCLFGGNVICSEICVFVFSLSMLIATNAVHVSQRTGIVDGYGIALTAIFPLSTIFFSHIGWMKSAWIKVFVLNGIMMFVMEFAWTDFETLSKNIRQFQFTMTAGINSIGMFTMYITLIYIYSYTIKNTRDEATIHRLRDSLERRFDNGSFQTLKKHHILKPRKLRVFPKSTVEKNVEQIIKNIRTYGSFIPDVCRNPASLESMDESTSLLNTNLSNTSGTLSSCGSDIDIYAPDLESDEEPHVEVDTDHDERKESDEAAEEQTETETEADEDVKSPFCTPERNRERDMDMDEFDNNSVDSCTCTLLLIRLFPIIQSSENMETFDINEKMDIASLCDIVSDHGGTVIDFSNADTILCIFQKKHKDRNHLFLALESTKCIIFDPLASQVDFIYIMFSQKCIVHTLDLPNGSRKTIFNVGFSYGDIAIHKLVDICNILRPMNSSSDYESLKPLVFLNWMNDFARKMVVGFDLWSVRKVGIVFHDFVDDELIFQLVYDDKVQKNSLLSEIVDMEEERLRIEIWNNIESRNFLRGEHVVKMMGEDEKYKKLLESIVLCGIGGIKCGGKEKSVGVLLSDNSVQEEIIEIL